MTEIPEHKIDELIASVQGLDASVRANADELAAFKEDQRAKDERASRRTTVARRWGLIAAVVALVALVGAGLGVNGLFYQNCRNVHSDTFNGYEHDKVCGQVRGVARIVPQTEDQRTRLAKVCGPGPTLPVDPRAGVAQFEDSSLDYLENIQRIGRC